MEADDISFGDIREAVVEKFCVEECEDVYQKTFLGCCTASMIQDEGEFQFVQPLLVKLW